MPKLQLTDFNEYDCRQNALCAKFDLSDTQASYLMHLVVIATNDTVNLLDCFDILDSLSTDTINKLLVGYPDHNQVKSLHDREVLRAGILHIIGNKYNS